jgi:TonB family protein
MFESNSFVSRLARRLFAPSEGEPSQEPKQRRLMVVALSMLVFSLVFVLYHDRDFWFPDEDEAQDDPVAIVPAVTARNPGTQQAGSSRKKPHKPQLTASAEAATTIPPIVATATRTVLPPLEVEVVAGDSHRTLHPGTNAIEVGMQPEPATETASVAPPSVSDEPAAANVKNNASERVEMSPGTSEVVSEPVKPGYPLLAREMKVQGSVILLAMISREGQIQELRVVSGPPILAGAAREAVKQWHFKPHYEGPDAVETVAKVTVNFTISTN